MGKVGGVPVPIEAPSMEPRSEPRLSGPAGGPSPVPKPVVAFFAALRKILGKAEDEREVVHEVVHEPDAVAHRGAWNLRVAVEPDTVDGGFVAECIDVPGAASQGETEEEALENLIDAVQGVVAIGMEQHFRALDLNMPPREAGARVLTISF